MRLVDIYSYPGGARLAYDILLERPMKHGISHVLMPSYEMHLRFMETRPFRYWLVIEATRKAVPIGVIECLPTNEFGVHILKRFQGRGLGSQAVSLFIAKHKPLPAIPAVRNGRWLANVAPANRRAAAFFKKLGFIKIQETYAL